jgi:hypothetical protein
MTAYLGRPSDAYSIKERLGVGREGAAPAAAGEKSARFL